MNELLVMTTIAGHRAAFRASDVRSVIELESIHKVPRAPAYVVGLTALRSQSLTVIDCRISIGEAAPAQADNRATVVEVGGHSYALLVDSLADVIEARSEPAPISGGYGEGWDRVAIGMVETDEEPALLIDVEKMVAGPPRQTNAAAA